MTLLALGAAEVKEEAAGALSTLALNSPSNQLAIATGLVALLGTGSAEAQEHVTHLLLNLAHDADNRVAIAKAGAIPRLIVQVKGGTNTSLKAQELAAAVLARLSGDSQDNATSIAAGGGIRQLVLLLGVNSSDAQAHAASVLSDISGTSTRFQAAIISEGGIAPLVALLAGTQPLHTKAEAAGALLRLASGSAETQKAVADAGSIKPLVTLLNEAHDGARMKAAGAISALVRACEARARRVRSPPAVLALRRRPRALPCARCTLPAALSPLHTRPFSPSPLLTVSPPRQALSSTEYQDAVEKHDGIARLVNLLAPANEDQVRAEAAAALAVLSRGNVKNQDKVAAVGGIEPLVAMLQDKTSPKAKEEAAAALWSLSALHYANQVAVAEAGGIKPLVAVLGLDSVRAQEQAASALAALALDNTKNELSIAELIVTLLGSKDKQVGMCPRSMPRPQLTPALWCGCHPGCPRCRPATISAATPSPRRVHASPVCTRTHRPWRAAGLRQGGARHLESRPGAHQQPGVDCQGGRRRPAGQASRPGGGRRRSRSPDRCGGRRRTRLGQRAKGDRLCHLVDDARQPG